MNTVTIIIATCFVIIIVAFHNQLLKNFFFVFSLIEHLFRQLKRFYSSNEKLIKNLLRKNQIMSKNTIEAESSLFKFQKVKIVTNQDYPSARSGHRGVYNESDDSFYIWGGFYPEQSIVTHVTNYKKYPELWQYNVSTNQWYILETSGDKPDQTCLSHSTLIHGNLLIVFGGTGHPFGVKTSNSIHICNLKNLEWKRLETHGEPPLKLYGSSIILKSGFLYVLFGTTGGLFYSNVYKIDLSTLESVKLFDSFEINNSVDGNFIQQQMLETEYPNGFLNGRYRQECILHKNEIIVFGGGDNMNGSVKMDTLPVFDLIKNKWKFVSTHADTTSLNLYPEERKCHSCIKIDQFVYMFGGHYVEDNFPVLVEKNMWRINLETFTWERLNIEMPIVTYFHASALSNSGQLWVHGGCTIKRNEIAPTRIADLFTIKLKIQKLADICWEVLLNSYPNLIEIDAKILANIGLPINYIKRIN